MRQRRMALPRCAALCVVAVLLLALVPPAGATVFPGPDAAGYRAQVAAFNLRNVSATGTPTVVGCDDCVNGPIPLPFTFNFYGADYAAIFVSSNGFVTFTSPSYPGGCCGDPIPTAGNIDNFIAGMWTDLYPGGGGNVRYATLGSAPNREFVVGYYGVPYCCTNGSLTFEIILHEGSHTIELQYGAALTNGVRTTTAGIENSDGTIGLQVGNGHLSFSNQGFLFNPGPPPPPETLAMPTREARSGTPIVVWGLTTIPNDMVAGIPTTYSIDFGDGTPAATGNVTDRSFIAATHPFPPGVFPVTLTVTRDTTTQTATTEVKVFDPAPGSAEERNLGINMAIADGLRSLWVSQSDLTTFASSATTNWGSPGGFPASITSMVVLAFENHGYRLPRDPATEPTGIYEKYLVRRGLNYIFDSLSTIALNRDEPAGDPCQAGVDPSDPTGCTGLGFTDFHSNYETAVATLAIAGSGAPNRVVGDVSGTASGGYVVGKSHGEILQRLANTVVWGQSNSGLGEGGWYYNLNEGSLSDGSTMGWAILALLDAEAAGATVPVFAKTELAMALANQLNADGSLDYQVDGDPSSDGSPNVAKTGIGLQGLYFTGVDVADPRVQRALTYIGNRWNDPGAGDDFFCGNGTHNKGCGYAMFNVFKGLKLYGIDTLSGVTRSAGPGAIPAGDWYADYVDFLVASQVNPTSTTGGQWATGSPGMYFSCCYYDESSVTALAELVLSPAALVLPCCLGLAPVDPTTGETGGSYTVTATATTAGGGPTPGTSVTFAITDGPNTGQTAIVVTNARGQAAFTYADTGGSGTDHIVARVGGLTSNVVTRTWTPADLSLSKSAPSLVRSGTNVTYSLTVTNKGTVPASGVTLDDPVPATTTFVSATSSAGSCTNGGAAVSCALGTVEVGATVTVTIVVVATTAPATVTNTATVASANHEDLNVADNSATAVTSVRNWPLPPSGLTATARAGAIILTWTDNSDDETGFIIERRTANGPFKQVKVVPANVTTYTDRVPNGSYVYRVSAFNQWGKSEPSNTAPSTLAGQLSFAPTKVTFSLTPRGVTRTQRFTLINTGEGTLTGTVGAPGAPFGIVSGGGAYTLGKLEQRTVIVRFAPVLPGSASDSLSITSNDPARASVSVRVTGLAR
jgi:uncharacterized repeat protein (TIGR01451 family)